MSCEHLICAQCAGPVVEGRCPACRQAKADVHHHAHPWHGVPLIVMAVVLTLLLMLALHLAP